MSTHEEREYITQDEALSFWNLLRKNLKSYQEKPTAMTDKEWLSQLFQREIPKMTQEQADQEAQELQDAIHTFDKNLASVTQASEQGVSKEKWLADKLQEASVGMSVNQFGESLQRLDDALYHKNLQLANALERSADGHIKMSPNLDGNIAEHMIASSAELSAVAQGKNIKVEVRDVFTPNSVDVRATNLDTGHYQNYQLKFGKDAKATIDLIERGNYNNQQIIVPSEQLAEVKAYFAAKGSQKNISDHIDAWGAQGKSFTKAEMKQLQTSAQESGIAPTLDYSLYQTKDLALSIGKNAGAMALQSIAITTGFNIAAKICNGEQVDPDQLVEIAIQTGSDTALKTVTAGTLNVAIQKGLIKCIAKTTPVGVIAHIACVGIENAKILYKIATGELTATKGLDQIGRTTVSMTAGLVAMTGLAEMAAGIVEGATIGGILGGPIGVVAGLVAGTVGYLAGSVAGDAIYSCAKKVASTAKRVGKAAVSTLRSAGKAVARGAKSFARGVASLFGF